MQHPTTPLSQQETDILNRLRRQLKFTYDKKGNLILDARQATMLQIERYDAITEIERLRNGPTDSDDDSLLNGDELMKEKSTP